MSTEKRNREILTYPNPLLSYVAKPVEHFDEQLVALFEDMRRLMHEHDGVGLAATQVGESLQMLLLSEYVFLPEEERRVIQDTDGDMGEDLVIINPEVIEQSETMINDLEGCLSFPEVFIKVKRPSWVKIKAQRLDGSVFEIRGEGLGARAILHEMDHLTGKVMTDHLGFIDKQRALREHQRVQRKRKKSSNEPEETASDRTPSSSRQSKGKGRVKSRGTKPKRGRGGRKR